MRYILAIMVALSIGPTYALSFTNYGSSDMWFKVSLADSCSSKVKSIEAWVRGDGGDQNSYDYGMSYVPNIPDNCIASDGRATIEFDKNAGKKIITVKDCEITFHTTSIVFSGSCRVADA